jgi:hypothetical protein
MAGIYEERRVDGLDIRTKFNKDWFRHSKVDQGDSGTHRDTDRMIITLAYFIFFQNKECRLKMCTPIYTFVV